MFITLKPLEETKDQRRPGHQSAARKLAVVPGATLFMQSAQDLTIGGRMSHAQYQYTLQGENLDELNDWAPASAGEAERRFRNCRTSIPISRIRIAGPLVIDRDTAARLGVTPADHR